MKRKQNRLSKELYIKDNVFFITICTQEMKCILSTVAATPTSPSVSQVELKKIGNIVENVWLDTEKVYKDVELYDFVIMPNHVHLLLSLGVHPCNTYNGNKVDVSQIIRSFKNVTVSKIKRNLQEYNLSVNNSGDVGVAATVCLIKNYGTIWQKSYYDHIMRDEADLIRIQQYIQNNPANWILDKYFRSDGQFC